jgi:hypothetical protein
MILHVKAIRHFKEVIGIAAVLCAAIVGVRLAAEDQGPTPFPSSPTIPSGALVFHDNTSDDSMAPMNYPDKFAWKLFLEVNQKAKHQGPVSSIAGSPLSNDAVWETWADDPLTFPTTPDPTKRPQWPAGAQDTKQIKSLTPTQRGRILMERAAQQQNQALEIQPRSAAVGKLTPGGFAAPDGNGVGEEVHRNKATFDYIVNNDLWYQEGIARFFAEAAKAVGNNVTFASKTVNFPRGAIEVKANWIVIEEKDKSRFHWNYNSQGQLLGLVAMHISSKDLPNWFWSTFEHIDNPGRGDFIGIHDSFGADPAHTASKTDKANSIYPAEALTQELLAMFNIKGYTGEWADEFKNYRLKGTQVDFTDSAGRPLLLGNSVTESGFVPTASCVTCHARATVNSTGANGFPRVGGIFGFGQQAILPLLSKDSLQPTLTYNGRPDPSWYYLESSAGTSLRNLQTDFVWAIPFLAKPAKKAP